MKVFVDTNILVDVFERRQPYYLDSANIIEQGLLGKYTLVISPLTIINTLYIVRKSSRNPKDFQGNNIRICLPHDFIIDYFQ